MKELRVATDSSRVSNKVSSRGSKEKRVNRVRDKKVSRVSNRVVNKLVGLKTVDRRRVAEIVVASIDRDRLETAGAITANCPLRFANACVKLRTCDAIGALAV